MATSCRERDIQPETGGAPPRARRRKRKSRSRLIDRGKTRSLIRIRSYSTFQFAVALPSAIKKETRRRNGTGGQAGEGRGGTRRGSARGAANAGESHRDLGKFYIAA